LRLFLLTLLVVSTLFASLTTKESYQIDDYIAQSFDLDRSFLQSENFQRVYHRYERIKGRSFINVKHPQTYFIPELEKILEAQGVPEVFLFMAMVESNFATKARSHKAAVGIWQFMPKTAKKFGLRIDSFVDERKDPIKSTRAAVKYLKFLYKMFGKWYLAALAYNAGEGTVLRAIKRAGSERAEVLLDPKKKYLPKESRIYLYKILSYAKLSYDFDSKLSQELGYILAREDDYQIVPVEVKGAETLEYIGERIRMKTSFLRMLNPHLIRGYTPPGARKYQIYIPKFKYLAFKKRYKPSNVYTNFIVYKTKSGDSLYKIAHRYGVSIKSLREFNHLKGRYLRVGKELIIPIAKSHKRHYVVKPGDTIIKIAKRFGVDPKKLKRWNDKKDNFLRVGERLVVLY